MAFTGPAYIVSVGYMDPGNWATDIAAGSKFGYALIWVLLLSNIMAVLLQTLSARLGIVARMDLAQACRAMFGRKVAMGMWLLAEVAIAACDLAEVLGSAIGLQLLFGLPLIYGVLLTVFDSLLILMLHHRGIRMLEAFIVGLISIIAVSLGLEIFLSRPEWGQIVTGFKPSLPGDGALFLAIGIIGATVMPHNLYLHSSLVQSRRITRTPAGLRNSIRFNIIDSVVALNGAFLINAALMIMAAATFFTHGYHEVAEIQDAYKLLEPILGKAIAPAAFAIALIASGQASTITGTLAGQIVMEGFVQFRLRPMIRRLLTRLLAIVPAVIVILIGGEGTTGMMLILSQVILSLQLPFAVIPLVQVVSDRRWMGQHVIKPWVTVLAAMIAALIVYLNLKLGIETIGSWFAAGAAGFAFWKLLILIPAAFAAALLVHVTVVPILQRFRREPTPALLNIHGAAMITEIHISPKPKRIAAAMDFTSADGAVLSHAAMLAKSYGQGSKIFLLHIVESGAAIVMGRELQDQEAINDQKRLEGYAAELSELGVDAQYELGFGDPATELEKLVVQFKPDLIVVGGHGHKGVSDFVHGTTVDKLRHKVGIPVFVVPLKADATE